MIRFDSILNGSQTAQTEPFLIDSYLIVDKQEAPLNVNTLGYGNEPKTTTLLSIVLLMIYDFEAR
jgi:hypothetical protein